MSSTSLEAQLHKYAMSLPNHAMGQNDLTTQFPNVALSELTLAINKLSKKNLVRTLDLGRAGIKWQAISKGEAKKLAALDDDEGMVYKVIESAGNEGIWTRHIKNQTNLHLTIINKVLKSLESRNEIKSVKSVKHPTLKLYMLYNLTPSVELTGGPWFTDNELDTEFIKQLLQAVLSFIRQRSFPRVKGYMNALFPPTHTSSYPTALQICTWIKKAGISSTELDVSHIRVLLEVLEFDGEIQALPGQMGQSFGMDTGVMDFESARLGSGSVGRKSKRMKEDEDKKRRKKGKNGRRRDRSDDSESDSDDSEDTDDSDDEERRRKRRKREKERKIERERRKREERKKRKARRKRKAGADLFDSEDSESESESGSEMDEKTKSKSKTSKSKSKKKSKKSRQQSSDSESDPSSDDDSSLDSGSDSDSAGSSSSGSTSSSSSDKRSKLSTKRSKRASAADVGAFVSLSAAASDDDISDSDASASESKRKSKQKKKEKLKGSKPSAGRKVKRIEVGVESEENDSEEDEKTKSGKGKRRVKEEDEVMEDDRDRTKKDNRAYGDDLKVSTFGSFENGDDALVYRAVRPEKVSLGWTEAPCGRCPLFMFCKEGGPVEPDGCVYYDTWLDQTMGALQI
ncbi:RNA polymerase III, subunit C34 [Phaffia rhodozyma]|uniref:RNA polymerase III, subunit C34 n=1 Tax=Phaffia rhodozyma TaxID=264483 RepID=A0A0F7SG60_PHARH|nr:RNA polymerase III, subunit C34 [Phaffia rhodozyma]